MTGTTHTPAAPDTRRALLARIGAVAGGAAMYQAMTALGVAAESPYAGPVRLDGDARGASVLILGAGLAGMVAAMELKKAGYRVQVLEYTDRAGGRCWSIRDGDRFTELGGETQAADFGGGHHFNPGPWRIPYHHHAVLDYCKRLGVALEPFIQVNHNALVHNRAAHGGRPQRYRAVNADYNGGIAELLAKATAGGRLDGLVTREDGEILLESLRAWGALNRDLTYAKSVVTSDRRGFDRDPGGGLTARPVPSEPVALKDVLSSRLWSYLVTGNVYEFQTTMFQPVGGMDMIARAMARECEGLIRFDAKVTAIRQDATGVTATVSDARRPDAAPETVRADWCLCTIPLSVLSQMEMNVGPKMAAAIEAVPYSSSVKVGLAFDRRFWEEDEHIYGGVSYTDLPIRMISYPSTGYGAPGGGVLLGAYAFGPYAYEFTALPAAERVRRAVEWGAVLHPQYRRDYRGGVSVGWHRVPGSLGCHGMWTDARRAEHYDDLCALDGRILLAGEHASYIPAWQEGAILSSLDAIARLHRRVVSA